MHSRARRRFSRGLKRKPLALIKKLRKAKKEAPPLEKPAVVKTHLRNMIVVPEMVGSIVGVYNGKTFNQVSVNIAQPGGWLVSRGLECVRAPPLLIHAIFWLQHWPRSMCDRTQNAQFQFIMMISDDETDACIVWT